MSRQPVFLPHQMWVSNFNLMPFVMFSLTYFAKTSHTLQLQASHPLETLPLGGTESLFKSWTQSGGKSRAQDGNFSSTALEARSNRVKRRDMFYFPLGSTLTFQFKLVSPIHTDGTITYSTDLRLEVKFKLPNSPADKASLGRRRRSVVDDRASLYRTFIAALDKSGMDGSRCLQRAVCEAAEQPLHEYGLLGEILSLLLTPGHLDRVVEVGTNNSSNLFQRTTDTRLKGDTEVNTTTIFETLHEDNNQMRYSNEIFDNDLNEVDVSMSSIKNQTDLWIKTKKVLKKLQSKIMERNATASNGNDNREKMKQSRDMPEVKSYSSDWMTDFIRAEEHGKRYGSCWAAFPECPLSMRELLHDAISSLSKNNHLLIHDEL